MKRLIIIAISFFFVRNVHAEVPILLKIYLNKTTFIEGERICLNVQVINISYQDVNICSIDPAIGSIEYILTNSKGDTLKYHGFHASYWTPIKPEYKINPNDSLWMMEDFSNIRRT